MFEYYRPLTFRKNFAIRGDFLFNTKNSNIYVANKKMLQNYKKWHKPYNKNYILYFFYVEVLEHATPQNNSKFIPNHEHKLRITCENTLLLKI